MAKFDIIAATGCPTGIAHTFMAKEALEKAAAERGLTIKVETHGQVGVENELTKSEIAGAKAVVVAADKDVQAERFAGKPMVSVGVSKALSVEAAGKLIDRALAAKGDSTVAAAADVEDEVEEKESIGHVIYKHLMNGVSHMLVFVVAGGVLTAVSFLWGITSFDSTASDYNSFAAMLKIIGGIAMNLMVPVLSAYIAESIGKRPALVPGFVAGMIAIQGLPVNAETGMIDAGGAGVGFGFLGGIVGGFLAGYVILLLEKVFAGLPKNLDGLKAIFLYPLFSTAIVGLVMLGMERTGRRNGSRRIICGRNLLIASVVMTVCMSAISYIGIAPIKALYVILPVLAVFYLVYHSYSTEFFVITVDCGAALGMMWLVHRALVSSNFTWMAYAVLIAAAVLTVAQIAVVHSVRGRQGKAKNTGKKAEARFSSNAFLMMTVTPILMTVLIAVVLFAPAHMLVVMGAAAAYLFVTAVYYTVKLM